MICVRYLKEDSNVLNLLLHWRENSRSILLRKEQQRIHTHTQSVKQLYISKLQKNISELYLQSDKMIALTANLRKVVCIGVPVHVCVRHALPVRVPVRFTSLICTLSPTKRAYFFCSSFLPSLLIRSAKPRLTLRTIPTHTQTQTHLFKRVLQTY